MNSPVRDWELQPSRHAHPIITLMQVLGKDHVLSGGPEDPVFLIAVSEEDCRAACELAELPLPTELQP